jgi:hypothetical protein
MGSGRSDLADWSSSGSGDDCPGEMFLDFERTANHTLLSKKDAQDYNLSSGAD